jgi:hypothetical protein
MRGNEKQFWKHFSGMIYQIVSDWRSGWETLNMGDVSLVTPCFVLACNSKMWLLVTPKSS